MSSPRPWPPELYDGALRHSAVARLLLLGERPAPLHPSDPGGAPRLSLAPRGSGGERALPPVDRSGKTGMEEEDGEGMGVREAVMAGNFVSLF